MLLKWENMTISQRKRFADNTIDLGQSIIKSSLLGVFSFPIVIGLSGDRKIEDVVDSILTASNSSFNLMFGLVLVAVIIGSYVRNCGYRYLGDVMKKEDEKPSSVRSAIKGLLLILFIVFASFFSFAEPEVPVNPLGPNCADLKYGTPKQSDEVLCREGYALGYNNQLKSAEWVSYTLDKETSPGVARQDDFRADPDIAASYQTTPEDYKEPKYDQGHLANSESIDRSVKANSETFLMSNMARSTAKT